MPIADILLTIKPDLNQTQIQQFEDGLILLKNQWNQSDIDAINSEHHDKQYQVALLESDLFSKIPAENQYDLIVSNPPYVDAEDMADLPEEFHHEPELARAAGQDGLDLVRKMLAQAPDYLTEDGLIVIEVGNSEWAMRQNFNTVDFYWLQFQKGGTGIFALTAVQCRQFRDLFIQSVQA